MCLDKIEMKRIKEYAGSMEIRVSEGIPLLQYPALERISFICHGFSTRMGGVSEGIYSSMSFKEDGDDSEANIRENYRRISLALGCDMKKMVRPQLCHGIRVHKVEKSDFGVGVLAKSTLLDYDGLITDMPGVTLVATFADCVPIYFVDTVHKAIGLAHSGWRGTVNRIALHMLQAMKESYGTEPYDVTVAIGPCICGACYEVGQELFEAFQKDFSGAVEKHTGICFQDVCRLHTVSQEGEKKYHLDLRLANLMTLLAAGVPRDQIVISDICSCCNPELIFSQRYTKGKRGVSAAFLGLQ